MVGCARALREQEPRLLRGHDDGGRAPRRRRQTHQAGWERRILAICIIGLVVAVYGHPPEPYQVEETSAGSSVTWALRQVTPPKDTPRAATHSSRGSTRNANGDTTRSFGDGGDTGDLHSRQAVRRRRRRHRRASDEPVVEIPQNLDDVGDCILLYGAFCNGNMGDVIQPLAMQNLLASLVPGQCFWYAHPGVELASRGYHMGEFFGGDESSLIHLQAEDASKVNRFKALIIGGGGIFAAIHYPLFEKEFAEGLTLPIAVLGVGAAYRARKYGPLLERAIFVSGRDATSIKCLSSVLQLSKSPRVQPDDVAFVRDTVLSDSTLTDTDGTCWKQSEGEDHPLCFILPASNFDVYTGMHRQLVANVVREGDVFINVFPKHQAELEAHKYPGEIREVLDPVRYTREMCSCKAIISGRLHGAILGLHMGVPTFGFFATPYGDKVPDLMIDTMGLPDQFFAVDADLTREAVDSRVDAVRRMYAEEDHRASIHARLAEFNVDFEKHAEHVLFDVIGVPKPSG